jgi:carbon monoxide dehydrogenase subunit G
MRVEGAFDIEAPREALYRSIVDPALMASCVPGCERIEQIEPALYRAIVTVRIGGIKARFNLVVELTSETPPESVTSVTRGEEGGRASQLVSNNELILIDLGEGRTQVRYASEVSITGRFGKFALGMMKKKATSLADEFARNLRNKIVPAPPAVEGVHSCLIMRSDQR